MKHRDTTQSVYIQHGCYSSTIFEMELWSLEEDHQCMYSDEEYKEQLEHDGMMQCGLMRESVGLFPSRERALEDLETMYDDPYDKDRELYAAFIREKAMYCMMQPKDYLKEWTYVHGHLHDESIVRNFAEDENPFRGRPKEMIRFKRGDIVMIPDEYYGHWGIVCEVPITPEHIKEVNDQIEAETGIRGDKYSRMDCSDDSYIILTSDEEYMASHEHIETHHVLPGWLVPDFVRKTLEEGLRKAMNE